MNAVEIEVPIGNVRPSLARKGGETRLMQLANSIRKEGLRHPIAVWADNVISGDRRLAAYQFLFDRYPDERALYGRIPAVRVDNIEDAAKRLLNDNGDEGQAVPLKPSEICRLWDLLRELDAPAAAVRLTEARRRGVEMRRQTQAGLRPPGRTQSRGKGAEYFLDVLGEPFGMKESTASRLFSLHRLATDPKVSKSRRNEAVLHLIALDRGESSIWASYDAMAVRRPAATSHRAAPVITPAPAAKQRATWDRALPQLEGLSAGLIELGPPNADLTWEQVGPVHARLMKVRRDLERIITGMKEIAKS